jgi:hypothetical protein
LGKRSEGRRERGGPRGDLAGRATGAHLAGCQSPPTCAPPQGVDASARAVAAAAGVEEEEEEEEARRVLASDGRRLGCATRAALQLRSVGL